jgi:hypothetical protein
MPVLMRGLIKLVPRKFLPWGSMLCGTILLLIGVLLLIAGYFAASHEAARTPGERNLGAGVLLMMFAIPALFLGVLGLRGWIVGLINLAWRIVVSRQSIQGS